MSRQNGTGTPVTTGYCYDGADRLLAATGGGAATYTYDSRGNVVMVTVGTDVTTFVYDGAGRHVRTVAPNGAGGTVTVTYTRDGLNRIIVRTVSGAADSAENGSFRFGFTALDDSADLNLDSASVLLSRDLGLSGGVLLVKDYITAGNTRWHYPNLHGDILVTLTGTGAIDGGLRTYDPFGTPITATNVLDADAGPNTTPGAFDYGWLGQYQRSAEHTAGLNYVEMGARVYDPVSGRFFSLDPVPGGGANDYGYPTDPIGMSDLNGQWWSWLEDAAKIVTPIAEVLSWVPGPIGQVASGVAAAGYAIQGNYAAAAGAAVGMLPGGKAASAAIKGAKGAKAAKGACKVNSFTAGTLVLLADGTLTAIEAVRLGDLVVATDPLTGETSAEPVTDLIVGTGIKHLVDVGTDPDADGVTDWVTATTGHPFWVNGAGWTNAGDLTIGNTLAGVDGSPVTVVALTTTIKITTAYNLTVSTLHTYYISNGTDDILVHNCNIADITRKGSGVVNRSVGTTPASFARNLLYAGYKGKRYPGGAHLYTGSSGSSYFLRPGARSHSGWTADYTPAGASRATIKYRF